MKELTFTFSGDEKIIDAGITSYAKAYGWTETIIEKDKEGTETKIPNPVSAIEYMEKPVLAHFFEVVKAYNGQQAQNYAKEQSDMATVEAMSKIDFNLS